MLATATVTDPLGGSAIDAATIASGGTGGIRTVRVAAFETRVNWGSAVDASVNGPILVTEGVAGPDYQFAPDGPITLAHTFTMLRDCNIVGARVYKSPLLAGTITLVLWGPTGTLLTSETVTWAADAGGWREIEFTTPAAVTNGVEYHLGYHAPDNNYAYSPWVFNAQDYVAHPFRFKTFFQSGSTIRDGMARLAGASLTFPGIGTLGAVRSPYNYYIDPIAEWDDPKPGFDSGVSYYEQWETAGSRYPFPLAVFFADPPNLAGYAALGVNTLFAGDASDEYLAAMAATDMDWYPALHTNNGIGDMGMPVVAQEDTALSEQIRGWVLTDEPDLITPYHSPADLEEVRDLLKTIDSSRPVYLTFSYLAVKNQGFFWQPTGASPMTANSNYRLYIDLLDMTGTDFYTLAANDSYLPTVDEILHEDVFNRYGIWCYPLQVQRMRELSDFRMPVWGIVETTSQVPDRPFPEDVIKAIWSQLIAGAAGILLFDHRFASAYVTQDFATILNNEPMGDAIAAMSDTLTTYAPALLAPEANLVASVESSNTTEGPIGGTYGVPIHYTSRQVAGTRFLFAQGIRPGATTGTFVIPDAADETITVIDEARTITADSSGEFSDSFAADYTYHLYTWGDVFAPAEGGTIEDDSMIDSDTLFDEDGILGSFGGSPIDEDTLIDDDTMFDGGGI